MTDEWRRASVAWRLHPVTLVRVGVVDVRMPESRRRMSISVFRKSPIRPPLEPSKCPQCHESFMPMAANQRYCSPRCRDRRQLTCANPTCAKRFYGRPDQRFCSCRCAGESRVTPENTRHRTCLACGEPFYATRGTQRTCSRACGQAWRYLTCTTRQSITRT